MAARRPKQEEYTRRKVKTEPQNEVKINKLKDVKPWKEVEKF